MTGMMDLPINWKLYDNPHYFDRRHNSPNHRHHHQQHHPYTCIPKSRSSYRTCDHRTTFSNPMGNGNVNLSDLNNALAEIKELRAELEFERRMRKMAEALNKALAKEASEEKRLREAAERTCGRIGAERTMKVERRMAEAMREERVQMKLREAKILMEEKIKEMMPVEKHDNCKRTAATGQEKQQTVENPHIKRGIKGMEFPKAVRVRGNGMSSRDGSSGGHLGSNLECQRAQLRVLMRNRSSVSSAAAGENLVM